MAPDLSIVIPTRVRPRRLRACLDDPERRTAIARAARRWAEENLALDSRVRVYEALYEEILG